MAIGDGFESQVDCDGGNVTGLILDRNQLQAQDSNLTRAEGVHFSRLIYAQIKDGDLYPVDLLDQKRVDDHMNGR